MLFSVCHVFAQTGDKENIKLLNQKVADAYKENKIDDALKYSRQILELSIKTFGAESNEAAVSYTNLGIILRDKQKYKDSVENLQNAVRIYQKDLPKNKGKIANVLEATAGVQFLSGKTDDAEKSGLDSLKLKEEVFGRESKEAYLSNLSLAEFYGRSKNIQKADEYYLKTYASAIKLFGKESSEINKIDDSRMCSTAMITEAGKNFADERMKLFGYERNNKIVNGTAVSLGRAVYPAALKKAGVEGAVVFRVVIDEEGNLSDAKPICGNSQLFETTKQAALKSKFNKTLKNGAPTKTEGYLVYRFVL